MFEGKRCLARVSGCAGRLASLHIFASWLLSCIQALSHSTQTKKKIKNPQPDLKDPRFIAQCLDFQHNPPGYITDMLLTDIYLVDDTKVSLRQEYDVIRRHSVYTELNVLAVCCSLT